MTTGRYGQDTFEQLLSEIVYIMTVRTQLKWFYVVPMKQNLQLKKNTPVGLLNQVKIESVDHIAVKTHPSKLLLKGLREHLNFAEKFENPADYYETKRPPSMSETLRSYYCEKAISEEVIEQIREDAKLMQPKPSKTRVFPVTSL